MSAPVPDVWEANPQVVFQPNRSVLRVTERVAWRIGLLVLTLSKFRGQAASIASLNVIGWSMRSAASRALLRSWWDGSRVVDLATTFADPHLEITLSLSAAEDLVVITSQGRGELSDRGREFAALIDADDDLLVPEKEHLRHLAPLNDAVVRRRLGASS